MTIRLFAGRHAVALAVLLPLVVSAHEARADAAAATSCAAGLAPEARKIFDATLPEVKPGVDLRTVVTARTRSLALSGAINRATARDSAAQAAPCLRLVGG